MSGRPRRTPAWRVWPAETTALVAALVVGGLMAPACEPPPPAYASFGMVAASRAIRYLAEGRDVQIACLVNDHTECDPVDRRDLAAHLSLPLSELAAGELPCAELRGRGPPEVTRQERGPFWVATGCGKSGVYILLDAVVRVAGGPEVTSYRFVRLAPGLAERASNALLALAEPGKAPARYEIVRSTADERAEVIVQRALELAELMTQASRDLECDAEHVVPSFAPFGRVEPTAYAEGCGKRVTYLPGSGPPFRAVAVVPIR